jgi:Chaperone of endosialidase
MKKNIYSLTFLFAMNVASFAQSSIILEPSSSLNTPIATIKKNHIGFSHESPNGLVKIGTWVTNSEAYIQTHSNHPLMFTTNNGNTQMTLATNGNFGIGNSIPLNKLDIGVAPGFSGNELALGNGTQGMSFSLNPSAAIWYTNTNFAMMPASGIGYLGIGTINPIAPLHITRVTGQLSGSDGQSFFPTLNGAFSTAGFIGRPISILAEGGIYSKNSVGSYQSITSSDNRIKKDFSLSNNSEDLELLRKIQITNYRMKDVATWGNQTFKKVIAQQVEEVYPEVIKMQTSVIPDIYTLAESVTYDAVTKILRVTLSKEYNIKIGEKIELVHPEKGKILVEVIAVSGKSFTVKNWDYATDKIFVFGREVNDFRSVDYEALSMLGISAIQQLAKEVDELKKANATQKSEFNTRFERMEASIKKLENQSIIK